MKIFLLSIIILSVFCSATLQAAQLRNFSPKTAVKQTADNDIPLLGCETEKKLDEGHAKVSEQLMTAASWLDSFFDNQRYMAEKNETRARMRIVAGKERFSNFDFKPRVSLRLHLPQLENRLHLIISASDDEDFEIDKSPIGRAAEQHSGTDQNRLTAGLRYFVLATKKVNIATNVGISFDHAYAGFRYRRLHKLSSWRGRFISRLRWYTDDGWDFRNQYDIEKQISDTFFFRTTADVYWAQDQNGLPHALTYSLFQVLSSTNAIAYDIGNYFQTRPNYHMTDFMLRVRYRKRFYRDWMVLEIAPQVTFPAEHNRRHNPGIVFKLEVDFGYDPHKNEFSKVFSF